MAKNAVSDWDTTPDNNTDIAGVNIAEFCPPSSLNDAIRNVMAQVKAYANTIVNIVASTAEVLVGTAMNRLLTPGNLYAAAAPVTLADMATITPDFGAGINFSVTLGGNRTLANPVNMKPGQSGVIFLYQDATGGRALAYGSYWKITGGVPVLSTTAGALDILSYIVASPTMVVGAFNKGAA